MHLHCATVVELEGHRCEELGRRDGHDLALELSADWLAEQQRILARLAPRATRASGAKKMKGGAMGILGTLGILGMGMGPVPGGCAK